MSAIHPDLSLLGAVLDDRVGQNWANVARYVSVCFLVEDGPISGYQASDFMRWDRAGISRKRKSPVRAV